MAANRDGVVLLDSSGVATHLDRNAQLLLGTGAATGQELTELLPYGVVADAWSQAAARGEAQSVEIPHGQDDHGERLLNVSLVPLPQGDGRTWLLLLKDVTTVRRMETLQRDFTANVSHELRTPLTAIRMAAETLQMGAINDARLKSKFLSNIQREADRLTRLVNEILTLANLEGRVALHLATFDAAGLCQDVISTMSQHAELNDLQLVADFPEDLGTIEADRDRLHQVILNLTDNALKCNRPNGAVTLKARRDGEMIEFQVIDTGIGIPPQDLPRIFERFFRVDKSRSRVTGGTGLGLSIVKNIIEAHGGTIAVTSTLDVGTTFTIRLPFHQPAAGVSKAAKASP